MAEKAIITYLQVVMLCVNIMRYILLEKRIKSRILGNYSGQDCAKLHSLYENIVVAAIQKSYNYRRY